MTDTLTDIHQMVNCATFGRVVGDRSTPFAVAAIDEDLAV